MLELGYQLLKPLSLRATSHEYLRTAAQVQTYTTVPLLPFCTKGGLGRKPMLFSGSIPSLPLLTPKGKRYYCLHKGPWQHERDYRGGPKSHLYLS